MKKMIKNLLKIGGLGILLAGAISTNNSPIATRAAGENEDIYCKVTCLYGVCAPYNAVTFTSEQDYVNFGGNLPLQIGRWQEYDITLYQDNAKVCLAEAAVYKIFTQGHTFRWCDHYGNELNSVTFSRKTQEEVYVYDCPKVTPNVTYNLQKAGWLILVNSVMDGNNSTYQRDIFNVTNYGNLVLNNSTIQNFNFVDAQLVNYGYDSEWYGQQSDVRNDSGTLGLIKNVSTNDEGIMKLDSTSSHINGITFENCHSNGDGGAIYVSDGIVENCTFKNCYAEDDGGAIYTDDEYAWIKNCTFENCHCDEDGGAIYCNGYAWIQYCNFKGCYCGTDGGAICVDADDTCIEYSKFEKCKAGDDGGAIYVCVGTDDVKINECTFSENHAEDDNDNIDGRSDTLVDGKRYSGSTISSGSIVIIVVVSVALLGVLVYLIIVVLKKKNLIGHKPKND